MDRSFANIKVILWDFDGTLYRLNPKIWDDIFEAQYRVIMNHTGWTHDQAVEEHKKLYKVVTNSSTDVVARICSMPIEKALYETEEYYDRGKYVRYDEKLVSLFAALHGYRHMMFVNGQRSKEEPVLAKLGVPTGTMEAWITPEETGVVKPDKKHAEAILAYTKLSPEEHLVVGDREAVDLVPPHELGMKTCLVYADTPGQIADVTLPDVYGVANLLV